MKIRRNTEIFTRTLENQISLLQQENQQLKEKIILLKSAEPMLELTKEYGEKTYISKK